MNTITLEDLNKIASGIAWWEMWIPSDEFDANDLFECEGQAQQERELAMAYDDGYFY